MPERTDSMSTASSAQLLVPTQHGIFHTNSNGLIHFPTDGTFKNNYLPTQLLIQNTENIGSNSQLLAFNASSNVNDNKVLNLPSTMNSSNLMNGF